MAPVFEQDMNIEIQPTPLQLHAEKTLFVASESKGKSVDAGVDVRSPPSRAGSTFSFKNSSIKQRVLKIWPVAVNFGRFMGPGTMISVAYIDPDNYQTAISSGGLQYKLLFMILVSNIIAIYLQVRLALANSFPKTILTSLQALSIKLGSVTGLDLAQMNRARLPRWLNIGLWLIAEMSIICTDICSVIGTAIAINILVPRIPLVAGCALSIADTLFILLFYKLDGPLKGIRVFEVLIAAFVLGTFICFCMELSLITDTTAGQVFKGFLPSKGIFVSDG